MILNPAACHPKHLQRSSLHGGRPSSSERWRLAPACRRVSINPTALGSQLRFFLFSLRNRSSAIIELANTARVSQQLRFSWAWFQSTYPHCPARLFLFNPLSTGTILLRTINFAEPRHPLYAPQLILCDIVAECRLSAYLSMLSIPHLFSSPVSLYRVIFV